MPSFNSFKRALDLTLAAMRDGQWHIGIGDPTIFGFFSVIVYFTATTIFV
jgi:hypothetical protein